MVASSHVDATGLASPSGMPFTSRRVRVRPQSHPPHPPTAPNCGPVYRRRRLCSARIPRARSSSGSAHCVRSCAHWARYCARLVRQIPASLDGKNGRSCVLPVIYTVSCRHSTIRLVEWGSGGRRFESGRPDWGKWFGNNDLQEWESPYLGPPVCVVCSQFPTRFFS